VADGKGDQSVEPIDNVTKGANVVPSGGSVPDSRSRGVECEKAIHPSSGDVTATDDRGSAAESGPGLAPGSQDADSIQPSGQRGAREVGLLDAEKPDEVWHKSLTSADLLRAVRETRGT